MLLSETESSAQPLVGMLVEQAGIQPLLAVDTSGALALDEQHHPELAIVDVDLGPGTSGLDLLCELKALRDTPVILLSGLSSLDIRVSGLELDADDYITKPFGDAELTGRRPLQAMPTHTGRLINTGWRFPSAGPPLLDQHAAATELCLTSRCFQPFAADTPCFDQPLG